MGFPEGGSSNLPNALSASEWSCRVDGEPVNAETAWVNAWSSRDLEGGIPPMGYSRTAARQGLAVRSGAPLLAAHRHPPGRGTRTVGRAARTQLSLGDADRS